MSNLKRLENLEKRLPPKPCKHEKNPGVAMVYDEASAYEAQRIRAVLDNCPRCVKEGTLVVFVLQRGLLGQRGGEFRREAREVKEWNHDGQNGAISGNSRVDGDDPRLNGYHKM